VLRVGGLLLFHDIFLGDGGPLYYPVPWAEEASISHLAAPETVRQILQGLGFEICDWTDKSQSSLDWFAASIGKLRTPGPPPLGLHLLMGETAKIKFENNIRNLSERRFVVFQAVAVKS
jgi:hypothetical protein